MPSLLYDVFQRTQTLLKEYKERDKSNVFLDKRLGEYNSNISAEEKMMRRFALEQQVWTPGGLLYAEVRLVHLCACALAHWVPRVGFSSAPALVMLKEKQPSPGAAGG